MKVPGINLPDVSISTGMSGDEMALVLQDSNLVLRALSDILSVDQKLPRIIAQSNIPFLIMPGDGAANGCQFTGTNGTFTLSAAIIANIGTSLAGCYAYFSANFGGSSLPAGWYWTEFSSDTAGIVYAETYTSGTTRRPVTKTPITPNLSGWVTGTTNEITGPTGFILPGDALGKNGNLSIFARIFGSTTGTKSYRMKIDSTTVVGLGSVGSPTGEYLMAVNAIDSHSVKNCGRLNISVPVGIGYAGSSVVAASIVSVDTSVDTTLSFSLQSSANMCGTILAQTQVIATYGE